MNRKILLIVEGEDTEVKILGSESHGLLSLIGTKCEIIPFKNPIYELYDAYKKGEYDDLVSYLRHEKGLKVDDNVLSKNAFSAIYLIFDFEPHYQKYSDEKIKELLNLFNNETELGKLYINYPMVESYYYLKSLPDLEYNNRVVSLIDLKGKNYKREVNLNTCLKKNHITTKQLCYIIMHNYNKAKLICNSDELIIDHEKILDIQLQRKKDYNEIYVLSMFPLLIMDYNFDKTMSVLKLKLKDNFIEFDDKLFV